MACGWCAAVIPDEARRDSVFCSKRCRQRAWRFRGRRAELAARVERAELPLRMAYADPPYPGLARRYYQSEASYAGEVDHVALIARLQTYDGWALSTGEFALRDLLPLCPPGARVCPWVKPRRHNPRAYGLHNAWEALIVVPGRRLRPAACDWLAAAPARLGGSSLKGRKPAAFVAWLFNCLGLLPGDELEDLFPGTGVVGRAWREVLRNHPPASLRSSARRVAASAPRPPAPARDASRVGRRRRVPLGAVVDVPRS